MIFKKVSAFFSSSAAKTSFCGFTKIKLKYNFYEHNIFNISIPLLIFSMLFFVNNCNDNTSIIDETDPVIDSLNLHYGISTASFFIGAQISDPQGIETINEVKYSLYYGETDSTGDELLFEGNLVDDGTSGDIIKNDGVFSRKHFDMGEGFYKCIVLADDEDGNETEIITKVEYAVKNEPPFVYMNEYTNEFEKGDTLIFRVKATDPQGLNDIAGVSFTIEYPDKEMKSGFVMRDDGYLGDETKGDGIYTYKTPTNKQSIYQGLWNFRFTAKDKGGLHSNTVKAVVKNPGVHVTNPDEAGNYNIGDTLNIEWESVFIDSLVIEYTLNNDFGSPDYTRIDTVAAETRLYKWKIPAVLKSDHCKIKLFDKNKQARYDVSDIEFRIQ